MARWKVYLIEKSYGSVTVEADSAEAAQELAEEAYENGNVDWGKVDFQVTEMEEV